MINYYFFIINRVCFSSAGMTMRSTVPVTAPVISENISSAGA